MYLWWERKANRSRERSGNGREGQRGEGGGDEHVRAAAFSILFVAGAGAERLEAERHALLDSLAAVVV